METLNFRKFFFEDMDPTPDKSRDKAMNGEEEDEKEDYFSALGDELGIDSKELSKIITTEPWVSAHFSMGKPNKELLYKLAAWEIVPGTFSGDGADIRLKHQKHTHSYLHGSRLNKSRYHDDKRYHLGRKELEDFLTTGWTPAIQSATSGELGGSAPPPMM
jgi:hypothetical protein